MNALTHPTRIRPSQEAAADAGNVTITTSVTGASFVVPNAVQMVNLSVLNNTGTTIEFQQDGEGAAFPIKDGQHYIIRGVDDLSRLGFRRTDQSNTPVSIAARWER